jgi:uncharacterized RDD family membrane protein YckC
MKCPKCGYLGFETGDRCRNCGYDFSLIAEPSGSTSVSADADLRLRGPEPASLQPPVLPDHIDRALGRSAAQELERPQPPTAFRGDPARPSLRARPSGDPALPLFGRTSVDDDEPLIKVPAAPRPPLSVRRTPDTPARRVTKESVHTRGFRDERQVEPTLAFADAGEPAASAPVVKPTHRAVVSTSAPRPSGVLRRVIAAAIDHLLLLAVDATVVYFTLRLAALTWGDWRLLPPIPLLAFLGLIKLAYFSAFTAVGGQTIGKMAVRIRVVADDNRVVDPACAARRSLAGALSLLTLGAGFLPALFTTDRRALHDRLAHTRVVVLASE